MSGTWRLYKRGRAPNDDKIGGTVHSVESVVDCEVVTPLRGETIFDGKEQVTGPLPLTGPCGVPPPGQMMFIPQDSYESIIRQHSQRTEQIQEKEEHKLKKMSHRQKYLDCIDLTHFADNRLDGECTFSPSNCKIKGRVFANSKKFVFVQHWKSTRSLRSRYHRSDCWNELDLYPCITRVVGHYDASCTRLCCHYTLLYPLGVVATPKPAQNGKSNGDAIGSSIARSVLMDIIGAIFAENESKCSDNKMDVDESANEISNGASANMAEGGMYKVQCKGNGDRILIIGRERFLILKEGRCLYFRDYNPHCDLSIPFYDEFHDKTREIYVHSRHFSKFYPRFNRRNVHHHRGGFGRRLGVRMMPYCEGTTDFAAYHPDHAILVLGEADFSFTLGLLRAASRDQNGKELAFPLGTGSIVGTSYLCRRGPTKSVYGPQPEYVVNDPIFRQFLDEGPNGELFNILHEIWRRKGRTFHGVDCRKITETLRSQLGADPPKFDRILFPFPRASLRKYDEDLDNDLIGGLFRSAQQELSPVGELHIILHTVCVLT